MISAITVAFLHVLMYAVILWLGWRSYRVLRFRSWLFIGNGFLIFFGYRVYRLISLFTWGYQPEDSGGFDTAALFTGTGFLVVGFWMLQTENIDLMKKLRIAPKMNAGDQTPEFWVKRQEESTVKAIRATVRPEFLYPERQEPELLK